MTLNSLQHIRSDSRVAFELLPFPELKYGLDIQVPVTESTLTLSNVADHPVSPFFQETKDGIVVCDLQTAFERFPSEMRQAGSLFSLQNKFESYHLAHLHQGFAVMVPQNVQSQSPVVLPGLSFPHSHVVIFVGKNSTVFIDHVEGSDSSNAQPVHTSGVEIFAEENAHVSYSSLQDYSQGSHFSIKRAHVGKNASVDWHWAELGSTFVKADISSTLSSENASSLNVGVFAGFQNQILDLDARTLHEQPHTKSQMFARGCVSDYSKSVYKGVIKMLKEAKSASGHQKSDVLILSPNAEADPIPILEIEGSDMTCSHAATVGRLDPQKLFYLTSRGIDEESARALYLRGFFEYALHYFPFCSSIRALVERAIEKRLNIHLNELSSFPFKDEVMV